MSSALSLKYIYVSGFFFFFQAEDGIRDYKVTGVQTCALPIFILGPGFVHGQLDSIVKARGGTGEPTGADSAALRTAAQAIVDRIVNPPTRGNGPPPGPTQCHDITVYPAIGLAGGACGGYGLLLDIRDVAHPK